MAPKANPEIAASLSHALGSRSQKWLADALVVKPTAVSQWINGKYRPLAIHLALIADLLQQDARELARAAEYDPEKTFRLYERIAFGGERIEQILERQSEELQSIRRFWVGGLPWDGIELGIEGDKFLQQELKRYPHWKQRQLLLMKRSEVLYQLTRLYAACLLPKDSFSILMNISAQQEAIASEFEDSGSNNNAPRIYAYRSKGEAYHLVGKSAEARRWYNACLVLAKDQRSRLEIAQSLCLASVGCGDKRGYKRAARVMDTALEREQFDAIVESMVLEAEGRGDIMLGLKRNEKLEKANLIVFKSQVSGHPMILRLIQWKRSNVLAMLYLAGESVNLEKLKIELNEVFTLAQRHGYFKYIEELASHVKKFVSQHPKFSHLLQLIPNTTAYPDLYFSLSVV